MRTLLSLAALLATFHNPSSDACGWQPPRVAIHLVTSHSVMLGDRAWRQRAFVVLGAAPKIDDAYWQALAPMTYDNTRIAELSPPAKATELTLVGASGTKVVSADHRVALRGGWQVGEGDHAALEVPTGFTIALEGRIPDAKWHALQFTYTNTIKVPDLGYEVRIGEGGYTVLVDGRVVTSGQGNLVGILDAGHDRFLVVAAKRGEPAPIYLGNSA